MIYVAVVCKPPWTRSERTHGDWASFIDKNKNNVITKALKARNEWERKGFGPYTILVGNITEEAVLPQDYTLQPLGEEPAW
jgi:hypothetical protein